MKYKSRKSLKFNLTAVAMIALLAGTIGAIFLTKPHSTGAFALEEQFEKTEFELGNALSLNTGDDLSWDDFTYLAAMERTYRSENLEASPSEVTDYLDNELANLVHHKQNLLSTMNSESGSWNIFGVSLTTAEILLFASYPTQAIQAYNASEDAKSKGNELYYNDNGDNHNPNAFRHGYWNALMEKRISKNYLTNIGTPSLPIYAIIQLDFAKMFADAHEYGKSGLGTDMDYLNNALGRSHGATYGSLSEHNMALEMAKRIANGMFYRIVNNSIVATNWEDLRPQFLYKTSPVSGGVSINGVIHQISGAFEIPSTINGQTVITIGNSAFANQTQLSQITIPRSVKSIEQSAFEGCAKLSTIEIPGRVKVIGSNAFKNCTSLTIHTEVISKPIGWDAGWNSSNRPVVWGGHERELYNDSIILSNYNYPSEYNDFDPIKEKITTQLGIQIETNRLRCGVINYAGKSYLTLSAKNRNATEAYLEYHFSDYLIEVQYQLALWGPDESLIQNSSIRLDALHGNDWSVIKNFSATSMSQNKDELFSYTTTLNEPTKVIRFIINTNQVNNDNNKGRVVIGDVNPVHVIDNHEHDLVYSFTSINLHRYMCQICDYMGTGAHAFYLGKCLGCGYSKQQPGIINIVYDSLHVSSSKETVTLL